MSCVLLDVAGAGVTLLPVLLQTLYHKMREDLHKDASETAIKKKMEDVDMKIAAIEKLKKLQEEQRRLKQERKSELEGLRSEKNKDFLGALKSFNVDDI